MPVVEDAAQAHGATVTMPGGQVRRAGAVGRLAAFSFYPGKNLGAFGDAGAVTTDDDELADRVARLRDHGRTSKYEHAEVGWGERLDALQAAVLAVKLERLEAGNAARERLAGRYDEALAGVGNLVPPPGRGPDQRPAPPRGPDPAPRRAARRLPGRAGVGAEILTPSSTCSRPGATSASPAVTCPRPRPGPAGCLSLPLYPELTEAQQDRVVEVVRGVLRHPLARPRRA